MVVVEVRCPRMWIARASDLHSGHYDRPYVQMSGHTGLESLPAFQAGTFCGTPGGAEALKPSPSARLNSLSIKSSLMQSLPVGPTQRPPLV